MMKDLVCGMQVDEKKSPTSIVEGKNYAFCSDSCKQKFDANPKLYASLSEQSAKGPQKEEGAPKEGVHKAKA